MQERKRKDQGFMPINNAKELLFLPDRRLYKRSASDANVSRLKTGS